MSATKRILREWIELQKDEPDGYKAYPKSEDVFDWHFIITGPENTPFGGGKYHGRMVLPTDYPFKPPSFVFLTPNGRFSVNTKICLSISSHHPEYWQPAWGIRTTLLALRSMLIQKDLSSIGSLSFPDDIVREYAQKSTAWKCNECCRFESPQDKHNISTLFQKNAVSYQFGLKHMLSLKILGFLILIVILGLRHIS